MTETSPVYGRVNSELKKNAESILSRLGITQSGIINMLYSQIVIQNGVPFDMHLPPEKPVAEGALTRAQFDAELQKGIDSMADGKKYTVDEVDAMLNKEFGI